MKTSLMSLAYSLLSIAGGCLGIVAGLNHQWIVWSVAEVIAGFCWWRGWRLLRARTVARGV
jgi:hypothetical protein